MLKTKLKNVKGITLIALVITIIVLLILAGVSIAMLTGENGILTQAQKAKMETENVAKQEEQDLAKLEAMINGEDIIITPVDDDNPGQLEQEGTDTLVINSIEDLVFFSYDVTTNGTTYEEKTVKLGTNLDFSSDKSYVDPDRTDFDKYGYTGQLKQALTSGTGFNPIGSQDLANSFYGTFDGDNKVICSLYENIKKDDVVRAGLFVTTYGEIRNLGLVNVNITAIAQGENSASVGGIARASYNNIYNCYVTGSINVTGSSWMPVGGLCGVMQEEANIENCYNLASIKATNVKEDLGDADIGCGGIVGQGTVNINKCYNRGRIEVDGGNNQILVGGIIGSLVDSGTTRTIKNCYNNAEIEGKSKTAYQMHLGGIVGRLTTANVLNCYNAGDILGNEEKSDGYNIGGIIGTQRANTILNNLFNVGKVINEENNGNLRIGGVVGNTVEDDTNISLNSIYNIGVINIKNQNSTNNVGSIMGIRNSTGILNNCYYLTGTYSTGVGSGSSTGVTEWDSFDEFPSMLSVVNGDGVFKEDTEGINNGYPILEWQ